jgi:chitodextrinase
MVRSVRSAVPAVLIATVLIGPAQPARGGHALIPPPGPAAPTELLATNDVSSITLSWTQPSWGYRPTHFRVYEGATVVARNTTTHVTVPGLGFGSTHTFRVTAVAANGLESDFSEPITRQVWVPGTNPACRPGPPTGLRFFDLRPTAVSLAWDPVDPPAPVQVSGGGQTFLTSLTHARIGGLTPATAHTLTVARRDCRGQLHPASVTVTTPAGSARLPGRPAAVTAGQPTATAVRLSWNVPGDGAPVAYYDVYRGATRVAFAGPTSVELTDLWRATTYPFTVVAIGQDGSESAHSAAVTVRTLPCDAAPPAPNALTASAVSASSVALHWVSETEAGSFTVYDGPRAVGTVRVPSAMITGLPSRSRHRYRVVADLPDCGSTAPSATVRVTTQPGPRARPTRPERVWQVPLPPRPDPTGTVVIAWTQPPSTDPVRGYRIYEGAAVLGTSTSTTFSTRLPPATVHFVSVVAVDAAGNESAQSEPISVRASFVLPP